MCITEIINYSAYCDICTWDFDFVEDGSKDDMVEQLRKDGWRCTELKSGEWKIICPRCLLEKKEKRKLKKGGELNGNTKKL
jgi:hypothetical protein